jgi:hypothetical protein
MCYTGKYKKEIESKYFKFIWDGKPEKVKKKNTKNFSTLLTYLFNQK